MRAAALTVLCALLGACELIADIPATSRANGDASGDSGVDSDGIGPTCGPSEECTDPAAPVCAATGSCRICIADAECPTNVCLADGTCAADSRFIYASPTGAGVACTEATPCSLDIAVEQLTTAKDIVKLAPGEYQRDALLAVSKSGIIAGGGSTLRLLTGAMTTAFYVSGAGVVVTVVGLAIVAEPGNAVLQCDATGGLILDRVTLSGGETGMYVDGCPFSMRRSRMSGSRYYAMNIANTQIDFVNSLIVDNVTQPNYMAATILLGNVTGRIVHSTIANNHSAADGALICSNSTVTIDNIIAWGNASDGIDVSCTVTHSIVDPAYPGGSSDNMRVDPMFVNAATGDYHIQTGSPASGLGGPTTVERDMDGEIRPQAPDPADSGADEIP